jgi:hypothetical protein
MYKTFFKPLTKNKTLEIDFDTTKDYSWFDFSFSLLKKTDHAGLYIRLSILNWDLNLNIIDNRNWNYDENRWYLEGEQYYEWLTELKDLEKQFKNNNLEIYKGELNLEDINNFYLKQFEKIKSDVLLYKEIVNDIKKLNNV